jgi:tetratricopeptide (TPR) repeat protein
VNVLMVFFVAFMQASATQTAGANLRNGWQLLEEGKYMDAQHEFEIAVRQNTKDSSPRLGLALVEASNGRVPQGETFLRTAGTLAKTNEAKLEYEAGAIRFYTIVQQPHDWLDEAKKHYNGGISISNKYAPLQYRMARAYIAANDLGHAQDLLAQVVAIHSEFADTADREWKRVQKILRASPATRVGAGIAMQDHISRADLCALLAGETSIGKLFTPGGAQSKINEPPDIKDHRLRQDVLTVLQWGIRGLEIGPDGKFAPNRPVLREEIAFVIEDILIKGRTDQATATRFVGAETSPFSDVSPTYAWFNSIMTVTSRGILEGTLNGKFEPEAPVEGADALLALRKLGTEIQ